MATPPLPAAKSHSVREILPQSIQNVMQYMAQTHRPNVLRNLANRDSVQKINDELLQIISNGINGIVMNLKNRLGSDFAESNRNAKSITDMLNALETQIRADINGIGDTTNQTQILEFNNNRYTATDHNLKFHTDVINHNSVNIDTLDSLDTNIMFDNNIRTNILNVNAQNGQDVNFDSQELQTRLLNCQNLEFLYLKKHDELMKVFAFIMNLFDKYKYAIKIILFLLKNLVNKDPPDGTPPNVPRVKLPITIIKNIKKLVQDQETIQGVVNKMDAAIIKTDNPVPTNLGFTQNTIDTIPKLRKATSNFNDGNIATPPVTEAVLND